MATYHLPQAGLQKLLDEQQAEGVFIPQETEGLPWLGPAGPSPSSPALSQPRPVQSPKGLFLPPTESAGQYGSGAPAAAAVEAGPVVLVGVRACELRARDYLDKVMLEGDFEDAAYKARREAMTIVSADCVDCTETCCCTLVAGKPFATEGFDVNLTPLDDGYVVEVATEKGRQWLGGTELSEATSEQLARRDEIRSAMVERLKQQNAQFTFTVADETPTNLSEHEDAEWQQFAADCVECGACTNICPTCHCFYLYDQVVGPETFERVRTWDSCLLSTYNRMAGGVNMKLTPWPKLYSRLANRVLHKFTYSPQQYGMLGCVGCGRCIEACAGAIDIRQVVQELIQ